MRGNDDASLSQQMPERQGGKSRTERKEEEKEEWRICLSFFHAPSASHQERLLSSVSAVMTAPP